MDGTDSGMGGLMRVIATIGIITVVLTVLGTAMISVANSAGQQLEDAVNGTGGTRNQNSLINKN